MKETGATRASTVTGPGQDGRTPAAGELSRSDTPGQMAPADAPWSIGELAKELGVTTRTIRFYEARHLITPRRDNGARVYGRRDRARMLLILRGKNLGFTLDDIREYLSLYDADPSQVTQTQLLLAKVMSSIDDLESKKVDLDKTLAELKVLRDRASDFLRARGAAGQ